MLRAGVYEEKLTLTKPNVVVAGEGAARSIISYGAAAGHTRPDGQRWGTGGSASLTINAHDVTMRNLAVRNSFDYVEDMRTHASGGAQAVALAIGRIADRVRFERCEITGYQDTLLVDGGVSHFHDCMISGCVDFIFGGGRSLIETCEIRSRLRPGEPMQGYVVAPSTLRTSELGYVFWRCRLTKEEGVPAGSVPLGRPWRAGGNPDIWSASAFLHCWMDDHIGEAWAPMGRSVAEGGRGVDLPENARFYEYRSTGPGALATLARRVLTAAQARAYEPRRVLGDWR